MRVCSVDGCDRAHRAKGYCGMHYERLRRNGDLGEEPPLAGSRTCSVIGCERKHDSKGFCDLHYRRWVKCGDPGASNPLIVPTSPICSITGCFRPTKARGWCALHYQRWQTKGEVGSVSIIAREPRFCSISGCDRPHSAFGLCHKHRQQQRRGGGDKKIGRDKCIIEGCDRLNKSLGYCSMHSQRFKKYGDPLMLKVRPKGSGTITPDGYVKVKVNGRTLAKHRIIMSEYINRPLLGSEDVHHRNGIRGDNRIENLQLWSTSHPRGQSIEDKVKWCKEFIEFYKDYKDPT